MSTTVHGRLFQRLTALIPSLSTTPEGAVLCALPRADDDLAVYCHVAAAKGGMRLIELADDNVRGNAMPKPWLKLRVDLQEEQAEVLEMEDVLGYHVVYVGGLQVNARRSQINMHANNWLQVLLNFELSFRRVDAGVIA